MHQNTLTQERALLVAVDKGDYDIDSSLNELEELAATADIQVVGQIVQKRDRTDMATAIGGGKLEEVAQFVEANDIDLVIFDQELSATQLRNLEKACKIAVIDRTMLILEIFAANARTSEGKLQVELAQHRYLLPRLAGMGKSLSRLGGGGGGGGGARRGKGESKLELDRRHIRLHITHLEERLGELTDRRDRIRLRRKKDGVTTVAIVGYTNVGKSTLLNTLTDAGVLSENKLFATLDPTSRALALPDGREVMLIDTVGLVRRLPHHLVEAFKSTLEEAVNADLLLNVCDISSPEAEEQVAVTNELLNGLGVAHTPILTVFNKCDKIDIPPFDVGEQSVLISAKTGFGMEGLLRKIAKLIPPSQRQMNLLIPYSEGGLVNEIRRDGKVLSEEYVDSGIRLDAMVDYKLIDRMQQYLQ